MREPIQQCRRELFIAGKHRHPFRKREVRGHHGRSPLVTIRDQIEEQLAADALKRDESDLIDLCGASHKWTNATPAVMWSEAAATGVKRTAIRIPTPHYW